ncbi:MAG: hypothetical protein LBH12_00635 [Dysgonamonadaceae bacterium]|jgi:uncharacterized protein YlzI (FlbEa/FlbD family)|nr:hypothetical protein [Dysgonamonadaceae bacterium]
MNLKNKDIQQLIENYFEGKTSLQEEQFLRNYFRQESTDVEFESYRPIFQYFNEERTLWKHKEQSDSFVRKKSDKRLWYIFALSAAACLFFLFNLSNIMESKKSPETTIAYIDGEKYTNILFIQTEILSVLDDLEENNEQVFSSQIELLDTFFE